MIADVIAARPAELSGSVLGGRYELYETLGEGGMATVYRGMRIGLRHAVAIKVLRPDLCSDERNVRRFLREARASSLINHPNVVDIVDFGKAEGDTPVYFVMEF